MLAVWIKKPNGRSYIIQISWERDKYVNEIVKYFIQQGAQVILIQTNTGLVPTNTNQINLTIYKEFLQIIKKI